MVLENGKSLNHLLSLDLLHAISGKPWHLLLQGAPTVMQLLLPQEAALMEQKPPQYIRVVLEEWMPAAGARASARGDLGQWTASADGVWLHRVAEVLMPGVQRGQQEVKEVLKMLHWGTTVT